MNKKITQPGDTNRIRDAFDGKKALIGFLTAGDPSLEKTKEFVIAMAGHGVDLIEIGIPFSDPVAEGEVIQRANARALSHQVTTDQLFTMITEIRLCVEIPIVLLTYMNSVFVYGVNRFFNACKQVGVDGLIIPDLPFEEQDEVKRQSKETGVHVISMVAPTSSTRIPTIVRNAKGFIYVVSSMGVTGVRSVIETDLEAMVCKIRQSSDVPIAIGFGISNSQQAADIARVCEGVIIGSAIVKIIEKYGDAAADEIALFTDEIRQTLDMQIIHDNAG